MPYVKTFERMAVARKSFRRTEQMHASASRMPASGPANLRGGWRPAAPLHLAGCMMAKSMHPAGQTRSLPPPHQGCLNMARPHRTPNELDKVVDTILGGAQTRTGLRRIPKPVLGGDGQPAGHDVCLCRGWPHHSACPGQDGGAAAPWHDPYFVGASGARNDGPTCQSAL